MTAFKKKVLAFALAGTFALSQSAFVNAAVDATETTNINKYDTVRNDMKLIEGDGQQVTLHKPLERYRAFVLYARMLGMASDLADYVAAFDATDKTVENFSDAAGQSPYVTAAMAYFKENGLSEGGNKGEFRPHDSITGQEFYKMMLQALGYQQDVDFTYEEVAQKALDLGLITDKDVAGSNKLEEVEIGAALYDALNTNVKPDEDAAADAPGVKLYYKLATENETAIPYLKAFDKIAPTLTVSEPHKIGSRDPGVADGATATDVTASATVDMAEGMPLIGTLTEPGTIYYNFNGVEGSFQTETTANADGKYAFDTTKLETSPEGSVKGYFPFINNSADNKNVVTIKAADLAGNETKELNWKSLIRTTEFVTGGNYSTSGSTLMVTGSSVDLYFTTDMNSVPSVKVVKVKTDKTGTAVDCKEVTAADVAAANLVTPLTIGAGSDIHIYKTTINFTDINTLVRIDATSGKDFGNIASGNGKVVTFQSTAKANLNPTFKGNAGGFAVSFPTEIDVDSAVAANFLRDGVAAKSVVVLDDNKTVFAMFENIQSNQYATVSVDKVKSKDGTAVMAQAKSEKITIVDTENPTITNYKVMSPNLVRFYFSEPIINENVDKTASYVLNGTQLIGSATGNGAYVDVVSSSRFKVGDNTIAINCKDDGVFPFVYGGPAFYTFKYAADTTAPVAELVKATNNYVSVKFPNDKINPSSVYATNASWSYSQSRNGAVASAAVCSTNAQGYDVITYYFTNSAMQVGSNIDFVFSGVRDMWNNQMGLTVLSAMSIEDKDDVTATFTIDSQDIGGVKDQTSSTAGTGNVKFKVTFSRPVKIVPSTTNNFVLKNKNGAVVNNYVTFAPSSTTVQGGTGATYGYTEYTFTLYGSDIVAGDYTLTLNNILDVVSGKTITTQTLPPVTAIDNARPRVVSTYTNGDDLFITFNMKMDETSVKNINNYFVSNASGTALNYFTLRKDKVITLSENKLTVQIPVVALPSTGYVSVLGVMSAQKVLIGVTEPNYVASSSTNIAGITQNILSGATIKVTGANKIQVTLAAGVQVNNLAYTDIGLYYKSPANSNDEVNIVDRYFPTMTPGVSYTKPTDAQGHTVITYDFTTYNAYTKDLFAADGRLMDTNGSYVAAGIYARTNSTAALLVGVDRFGRNIAAGDVSGTFTSLDGVKPVLKPSIADMASYPIVMASTSATGIDAFNLTTLGISNPQAVVYLGFSEAIDSASLTSSALFAAGITIYNNNLQRYLTPSEFHVGPAALADAVVTNRINTEYNYNRLPYYATNDTIANGASTGGGNVVAIYIDATPNTYNPSNSLIITMPNGVVDVNGNNSDGLGSITAYTIK